MRKFQVTVNGKSYEVEVEELGVNPMGVEGGTHAPVSPAASSTVAAPSKAKEAPKPPEGQAVAKEAVGSTKVEAPMQGKIVNVAVSIGTSVKEGDVLAVLEAMKMENEIVAPQGGTVASIHVSSGQSVESGDLIISLK